jgi:hypothetical protein
MRQLSSLLQEKLIDVFVEEPNGRTLYATDAARAEGIVNLLKPQLKKHFSPDRKYNPGYFSVGATFDHPSWGNGIVTLIESRMPSQYYVIAATFEGDVSKRLLVKERQLRKQSKYKTLESLPRRNQGISE